MIFFLFIFFTSCSTHIPAPEQQTMRIQEVNMAEVFLEEFLFEHGGCYTLFGDKPITSMCIFRGKPEDWYLDNLSPEALKTLHFVDNNTVENFEAWRKILKEITPSHFFFVNFPAPDDPICDFLYLVNISKTKKIFDAYFHLFYATTGINKWEQFLSELQKPNTELWKTLFEDHYLAGLLYGFGQENAKDFCDESIEKVVSEKFEEKATKENFPIPIYATFEGNKVGKKYQKQRAKIKKKFCEKSILQVTLQRLTS